MPTSAWTGNVAALSFMKWIGMDIDFIYAPILSHLIVNAKNLVYVRYLEIMLHYKFHDPLLLVKTIIHGSYVLHEIPRCY